ncbi:integrase core domain-containing protein [Nonomuraea angiospora]|uniref:integrase core domain-containing protein n=1 Tax=Nonomuraea angiospora TaxID=46172 RepID=UPI00344D7C3B
MCWVFIEHGTRRLHLAGVTAHSALQQARNLVMDVGDRIAELRLLVHDRDPLFTSAFREVSQPKGYGPSPLCRGCRVCERVIGTLRRELLDRILILSERHLTFVLREYLIHYNGHRPHQSRCQRSPDTTMQHACDVTDLYDLRTVRRRPVVAGVINEYHHAA